MYSVGVEINTIQSWERSTNLKLECELAHRCLVGLSEQSGSSLPLVHAILEADGQRRLAVIVQGSLGTRGGGGRW